VIEREKGKRSENKREIVPREVHGSKGAIGLAGPRRSFTQTTFWFSLTGLAAHAVMVAWSEKKIPRA
jgi:hypothetical protein